MALGANPAFPDYGFFFVPGPGPVPVNVPDRAGMSSPMDFEKLDVFVALAHELAETLPKGKSALRNRKGAAISVPLNIAESAGEYSRREKSCSPGSSSEDAHPHGSNLRIGQGNGPGPGHEGDAVIREYEMSTQRQWRGTSVEGGGCASRRARSWRPG